MASREAAHINHARSTLGDRLRKRSLGPLFSFHFHGYVSPDLI